MYKINFDKYANLLTWGSIYWGIKKELIMPDSAVQYAGKIIENNPDIDNPAIIELLIDDTSEKDRTLLLVDNIISNGELLENSEQSSLRLLKYVLLIELRENTDNRQELLDELENIYADFNYPADMESFISYMPVQDDNYDVSEHTDEENIQRLIDNFYSFMTKESEQLGIYP